MLTEHPSIFSREFQPLNGTRHSNENENKTVFIFSNCIKLFDTRKDFFDTFCVKLSNTKILKSPAYWNWVECGQTPYSTLHTPTVSIFHARYMLKAKSMRIVNVPFSLSFEFLSEYQCSHTLWIEQQCDSQCIVTNCQSQDRMFIFFSPSIKQYTVNSN